MTRGKKAEKLRMMIRAYGRMAVAFSGGVDSSFLLKIGLDSIGAENILAVHGQSSFLSRYDLERVDSWFEEQDPGGAIRRISPEIHPLTSEKIIKNTPERCYFCKQGMYNLFLEESKKYGYETLADGTNVSDLKMDRPGLRAIHELGIKMPLVEAGFDKHDIRYLSRTLGMKSWNEPSSSCLATRIPHGMEITADRLERISNGETFLHKLGFFGCRVRIDKNKESTVFVEVQADFIEEFVCQANRVSVVNYFQSIGIYHVYLSITGHSE